MVFSCSICNMSVPRTCFVPFVFFDCMVVLDDLMSRCSCGKEVCIFVTGIILAVAVGHCFLFDVMMSGKTGCTHDIILASGAGLC